MLVYNTSGQPGSQATIRVRGTGSISAASDPLYVVDGIIGGSFNPNDIETLTVLKDAGATALYGSEGAGGVIVITTKSAKTGQKTTVNFKLSAGVKSVLSGRLKMMDSRELYDTQKSFMPEVLFNAQRPESLLNRNFDWTDAIFRTGVVQNYYASVAGSSARPTISSASTTTTRRVRSSTPSTLASSARVNLSTELYKSLRMNTRVAIPIRATTAPRPNQTLDSPTDCCRGTTPTTPTVRPRTSCTTARWSGFRRTATTSFTTNSTTTPSRTATTSRPTCS